MYGIFGKPLKRAFQTCMGHGGVGGLQKKLPEAERRPVWDFRPIFRDFCRFSGISGILTQFCPRACPEAPPRSCDPAEWALVRAPDPLPIPV